MSLSVAVAGASGYAGGEVLRLLLQHPEFSIGALTAHSQVGASVTSIHSHLRPLKDRTFVDTSPEALAGHHVVVLALPHGTSGAIAEQLPEDTIVLDCGADHRLHRAEDWREFYHSEHAGSWPYGLPELITATGHQRDALAGARRIAVPGCNVTAVTLGLQPGIAAGVIEPDDIVAVLANGYSGAGRTLAPHLLAAEGLGSAAPYAVGGSHRHIPEICQNLQIAGARVGVQSVRLSFTPTLVPMSRGILATATARLAPGADAGQVRDVWCTAYADEPFIEVLPEGSWPTTGATLGGNGVLTQVAVDERVGRVVTVTAIDNLVKGTAGSAIQSLNIALGLPETMGLTAIGVAP